MIETCKKNAMLFSKKVRQSNDNSFPEYFDWSDHVAIQEIVDYPYHLNKTVIELDALVDIFMPHIDTDHFELWKKEWYEQTISAAWIHDIGMLNNGVQNFIKK